MRGSPLPGQARVKPDGRMGNPERKMPGYDMPDEAERRAKLARQAGAASWRGKLAWMEHLRQLGEKACDDMYGAHCFQDANCRYLEAKECFDDAIGLAGELGWEDEAASPGNRLQHVKGVFQGVFRSQFVQ